MGEEKRIGKYEIRRELGRGAMGVVYEGYDPLIKRSVALKTIRSDQLEGDHGESAIARFRREAQASGRLTHPNIVSIYEFGEEAGTWYIAMELVKGRELKDYFQANERFAAADVVRIMTQILAALGFSHRLGVVHRDIKPANVFLLDDGSVKVTDFGIAHIETSSMTQAGAVLGTPAYMSPEQILGNPVDGRSDLFSAGVILYQFLTGERPFSGSSTATMHKVLEEEPLPPSRFNVQVPGAMDAVVRKALAKRPDDRYQSAEEFAVAIRGAMPAVVGVADNATMTGGVDPTLIAPAPTAAQLRQEASRATATTTSSGATSASAGGSMPGVTPPPTPPPASPTGAKSQTTTIAIVAGIAAVVIAAGVYLMTQRSGGEASKVAQAPATTGAASPSSVPVSPAGTTASPASPSAAPSAGAPTAATSAPATKTPIGSLVISAVGLVDPRNPRYASDKSLLQSDLRADSVSQTVAKALGLLLESSSMAKNYGLLKEKLLSKSGDFVTTVVRESAPREGQDGLVSMTTEAVVNVKALQKSLNQMSRDERVESIRAGGDPKIAVKIVVREADSPNAPAQGSPVAENLLKERIKSFGFRTWSDDGGASGQLADFAVLGEAQIKKLSMKLEASGVVINKYTLTSWTVKAVDRATGEEIYFNTALPKGVGSWASEGEALKAIGAGIADEFTKSFFLQHLNVTGRKVTLTIEGLPGGKAAESLARQLIGLPAVITATPRAPATPNVFDLQVGGSGPEGDLVANAILRPLNAQLGQQCFALGAIAGEAVTVTFDKRCADAPVLSRLDTQLPAGLYSAPPGRQKDVISDPETLKRLTI